MTKGLKSCPFCGSEEINIYPKNKFIGPRMVACSNCNVEISGDDCVWAWNTRASNEEVKRLRDGIAYVVDKHPYARLKALMDAILRGEDHAGVVDSEMYYEDRLSRFEKRTDDAERQLANIVRAVDDARKVVEK